MEPKRSKRNLLQKKNLYLPNPISPEEKHCGDFLRQWLPESL
jgi:hypothetical protein